MIGVTARQKSLFFAALEGQTTKFVDPMLQELDRLLDDEMMIAKVAECLGARAPKSSSRGRHGMAADRLLRLVVLKQLRGWSFRELEREVNVGLLYRSFTRFDESPIPSFETLSRNFAILGEELVAELNQRVVRRLQDDGHIHGQDVRTDTTVVESNIHPPSDSTLLADSIRVLTRAMRRLANSVPGSGIPTRDHRRSVTWRVLEIHRAARVPGELGRTRRQASYRRLIALTQTVQRAAAKCARRYHSGEFDTASDWRIVMVQIAKLEHFLPLTTRVVEQTCARIEDDNRRAPNKIVSLFEPHTEIIRKGKSHKPTEFGRLVRIDEVEAGVVSGYDVLLGNPSDTTQLRPALDGHIALFGRSPRCITADRGYFSAANERYARERGVRHPVLPARGRLSQRRATQQKRRWFRRALRWRGGVESRIATLKHRFAMGRAMFKGDAGFRRWVGFAVLTHNLVRFARLASPKLQPRPGRSAPSAFRNRL